MNFSNSILKRMHLCGFSGLMYRIYLFGVFFCFSAHDSIVCLRNVNSKEFMISSLKVELIKNYFVLCQLDYASPLVVLQESKDLFSGNRSQIKFSNFRPL